MIKPQWRTLSIRVEEPGKTSKAVAIQARFPLGVGEWARLLAKLDQLRPELVEDPEADHD
jgi:hypothetical protein